MNSISSYGSVCAFPFQWSSLCKYHAIFVNKQKVIYDDANILSKYAIQCTGIDLEG